MYLIICFFCLSPVLDIHLGFFVLFFCFQFLRFSRPPPSLRGKSYFQSFILGDTTMLFTFRVLGPDFQLHHGNSTNLSDPIQEYASLFPGALSCRYKENLITWKDTSPLWSWCQKSLSFPRECVIAHCAPPPRPPHRKGRGVMTACLSCGSDGWKPERRVQPVHLLFS